MSSKDNGRGADSVHDFIVSLEAKAKRILKNADKKRREDARLEAQKLSTMAKSSGVKKMAQNGSVLMPLIDSSTLSSTAKLPTGSLTDKLSALKTTLGDGSLKFAKTQLMHYSVPKLTVSLQTDTVDFDELAMSGKVRPHSGSKVLDPLVRPGSAGGSGKLTYKNPPPACFDKTFLSQSIDASKTSKVNKTLKRLDQSPFMSGDSTNLVEFLETGKQREKKDIAHLMDSTWSLKTHATGSFWITHTLSCFLY